ncbi:MAG TPA: hypothetical protein VIJ22_09185 [Polyangiaceae bacterium]
MSRDELVAGALVLAFAVLVTAHVALVVGLAGRAPRWRALVALAVPPLAPYWGWSTLRRRSVLWVASAVAYGVLRLVASR